MIYIVEIPHQRKSFAWMAHGVQDYLTKTIHARRDQAYDICLIEDLQDSYSEEDVSAQLACPQPPKGTLIYKGFGEQLYSTTPVCPFEEVQKQEASDLHGYYVFMDEEEARAGLLELKGHNVHGAIDCLTRLLEDEA